MELTVHSLNSAKIVYETKVMGLQDPVQRFVDKRIPIFGLDS